MAIPGPERSQRWIGVGCALGAVALGIAYLALAGAPARTLAVQALAAVIGWLLFAAIGRGALPRSIVVPVTGAALLATALLGTQVDGVARWVRFGPLLVEPSLILLPVAAVALSRSRGALSVFSMVVMAVALALQPDRAMAGALFAVIAVLAAIRRDRATLSMFVAAAVAFAATLARADTLAPQPFVEGVLAASLSASVLAACIVSAGLALLLAPALLGLRRTDDDRAVHLAFGAMWLAIVVASVLGAYPTPVVGAGGSAIIGYFLSLAALDRRFGTRTHAMGPTRDRARDQEPPRGFDTVAAVA